jgi:hypothetical protein
VTAFVVRYETRPEAADENRRLVEAVYAELNAGQPDGLCYATFRLADGVTFVHIAITEGERNPLMETAAFQEFQRGIGDRLVRPPVHAEAEVVGSYRFPG